MSDTISGGGEPGGEVCRPAANGRVHGAPVSAHRGRGRRSTAGLDRHGRHGVVPPTHSVRVPGRRCGQLAVLRRTGTSLPISQFIVIGLWQLEG